LDSISSKDSVNKGAKPHSSKDDISHDRNINSDKNRITETGSNKKDRPSDLNFGSKTEIKKSIDPKSSPRKHKVDHVEPMVTSEINNLELKPVPTPRHPKGEKETSPVNGFPSKNRDKTPDVGLVSLRFCRRILARFDNKPPRTCLSLSSCCL
jgi:hypothetical protein